jgi:hypothetical protein
LIISGIVLGLFFAWLVRRFIWPLRARQIA